MEGPWEAFAEVEVVGVHLASRNGKGMISTHIHSKESKQVHQIPCHNIDNLNNFLKLIISFENYKVHVHVHVYLQHVLNLYLETTLPVAIPVVNNFTQFNLFKSNLCV